MKQAFYIPRVLLLSLFLIPVLLAGCVSSGTTDADLQVTARKAAESNTSLGLEYMNRGQFEVAMGKLKKAVAEDPGYAPGHTVLAVLYGRLGESELAGKHYRKAYEADPVNGDVNNNYGVYLCQVKKIDQATEHFLKALDDPFYRSPAVALTNAGSCALGQDKLAEANDFLRQALRYDPKFPDALVTMARLNYLQKDFLRSRAFMQRYEADTKHSAETLLLAFQLENAMQDQKTANRYLLALKSNFPDSEQTAIARRLAEQ